MKLSLMLVLPMLALVAGCNTPSNGLQIGGLAVQPGGASYPGTSIFPVGDVKLAQAYVTQKNSANTNLPYIQNICPNDFKMTKALIDIATKYQSPQGTSTTDDTENYTTAINASITGIPVSIATVGANVGPTATTNIKYSGVQLYSVDNGDLQTVWQSLGDKCKQYLKTHSGFIVAGAARASSINIEVKKNDDPNVTAGLRIGPTSPGFAFGGKSDSDVTLSGSNLYFKVTQNSSQ